LFGRWTAIVLALALQAVAASSFVMRNAAPASATTATPTAYVLDLANNAVTSIDTGTNAVGSTASAGSGPGEVTISPDGTTAYVVDGDNSTVTPILLATDTAEQPIDLPANSAPSDIAITPDGSMAYVVDGNTDDLTPIDPATDTTEADINLTGTGQLFKIAITPDGSTAYVTDLSYSWNFGDGSTAVTSSPTTTHVYAGAGHFNVTLTETDSTGTSTTQVFTGQTVLRNGGASATTSRLVTVLSRGYWEVGQDGGVFAFGDAGFYGSLPKSASGMPARFIALIPTVSGKGYWLVDSQGEVFPFGDATGLGVATSGSLPRPIAAAAGNSAATGLWLAGRPRQFSRHSGHDHERRFVLGGACGPHRWSRQPRRRGILDGRERRRDLRLR
jgi:YVTN family beta-propeller protein